jgi:hypothetical protein
MKLEVGKRYVTRGGAITAPLVENKSSIKIRFPFMCPGTRLTWTPDGEFFEGGDDPQDLVAEYAEPCPPPDLPPGFKAVGWGAPRKGDWYFSPCYNKPVHARWLFGEVHLLLEKIEPPVPEKPVETYPKYYAAVNPCNSYIERTSETEATVYRKDGSVAESHTTVWKLIEAGQREITREGALALVDKQEDMDG